MLKREIIAVCSEIHAKHINALCEEHGISVRAVGI
jgi:ribosomal protein L7Ae-like RNA K-turn-binding protein